MRFLTRFWYRVVWVILIWADLIHAVVELSFVVVDVDKGVLGGEPELDVGMVGAQ